MRCEECGLKVPEPPTEGWSAYCVGVLDVETALWLCPQHGFSREDELEAFRLLGWCK